MWVRIITIFIIYSNFYSPPPEKFNKFVVPPFNNLMYHSVIDLILYQNSNF